MSSRSTWPARVPYDSATPEHLAETVRLVEATGRNIVAAAADTRDLDALRAVVDLGVEQFGRLDVIVANAGITAPEAGNVTTPQSFQDVMDTNVTGTWNAVIAGAKKIIDGGRGGSIILVSSAASIKCSRSWCITPPVSTPTAMTAAIAARSAATFSTCPPDNEEPHSTIRFGSTPGSFCAATMAAS